MTDAHGPSRPREPGLGALNIVVLGPFLPAMAVDLDVGVPLLGQAPALANLIAAGTGLLIGPLADRYGQRRTLALGLLALAVSSLGVALAPGYVILVAAVLIGAPVRSPAIPLMLLRGAIMAATLLVPAEIGPSGAVIATVLFGLVGLGDGVYLVSVVLALTGESPAGRGTTMVANGSAVVFGNAIGSAIGGLLLAVGGYALMALHPPLATVAAAVLIWRSGRR